MKRITFLVITLFFLEISLGKAQYSVLLNFNSINGSHPTGSLTQSGNVLFGMTYEGGHTIGTVFSIHTDGSRYKELLVFDTTNGGLPHGSLVLSGATLYGMTSWQNYNFGNIFSIDTDGTGYRQLLTFTGLNGSLPQGSLVIAGNVLFGMTVYGGVHDSGCIFSINTNGSGYQDLHDFTGNGGTCPYGSLTLSGSVLYGMTHSGGKDGWGCIFSINTNGSGYTDLLDFNLNNGANPFGSLTISGNVLYGMTIYNYGRYGNIFSINTNGGGYNDLLNFDGTAYPEGDGPIGSLTLSGTTLYGTANYGGANNYGCFFSMSTNGTGYKDLFDFDDADGANPQGDLTLSGNMLYGMTAQGGPFNSDGVLFRYCLNCPVIRDSISSFQNSFCMNNGSASLGVKDGTSPYIYLWMPGGFTTESVSGLSAGTYTVTVTDYNGCSGSSVTVTITAPSPIQDSIVSVTNSCSGEEITLGIKGGTPQYTYLWTPGGQTTATATGLSSAAYTVNVTDKNGCNATTLVTITQPPLLQDSIKKVNISCHGANDGKRKVFPYGGVPPYTYLWSDGSTKEGMSGLAAGTYSCTVTDNNGCSVTASETIIDPLALSVSLSSSAVKCFGGNTGLASITSLTGGTPPYTYLWAPPGITTATLTGASAGTYTLTVHDKNGCSTSASVRVTQASKIRDSITTIGCGTATVGVRGGTPGYNYRWTPSGGFTATAIVYTVGIYTVTITDRNGCTASTTANIICPSALKHKEEVAGNGDDNAACCDKNIIVYPNPNNGVFTIAFSHPAIDAGSRPIIEIYNVLGQRIFREAHSLENGYQINLSTQPSGIYMYLVIEANGNLLGEGKIMVQK